MRRSVCSVAAMLWALAVVSAAFAYPERVEEVWRSPFGNDRTFGCDHALAPSPSDGSFWLIEGATVAHYDAGGMLLTRSQALSTPWALTAVNGSCWVLQATKDELAHLGADGALLSTTPGPTRNAALLPSPADGSVWVSDAGQVAHVDASGNAVWTLTADAKALAADPGDGSVWMVEGSTVVRRASDGSELWRASGFGADVRLGEDPRDQSVWVGDATGLLTHLSASGQVLLQIPNPSRPVFDVQVLPADGSLWVNYWWNLDNPSSDDPADNAYVARLDASGTDLFHRGTWLMSTNLRDGSAWIAGPSGIMLYSADGDYVDGVDSSIWWYAFDPVDSGYWATGAPDETASLSRYGADGTRLWTQDRAGAGWLLWADPSDGSCWINDPRDHYDAPALIHVSPEGEELGRRPLPPDSATYFVSPLGFSATDHTWWARDGGALVCFAEDGAELWRQTGVFTGWLRGFEVSPVDGSLWLTSSATGWGDTHDHIPPNSHLVHLAADGTVLSAADYDVYLRGLALTADGGVWTAFGGTLVRFSPAGEAVSELPLPAGLAGVRQLEVNPSDGSIYGGTLGAVFRMATDGTLLWQLSGFYDVSIALAPEDGSLWIANRGESLNDSAELLSPNSQVARISADGQLLWQSSTFNGPEELVVNSYDGTPWLYDSGNEQVVHLQAVPSPFPDVSADSWAFDAIAACAAAGIVQGYWDGYRPDQVVTRDQMAVYIARALALPTGDAAVPTGPAEPTFPDVDEEHWAYQYVEYCYAAGVVEGYPDGNYQPDEPVNRGQMAVYIARSLVTPSGDAALPDAPEQPTFTDVTADNDWSWCYPHVEYCAAEGIVQGYWDGYHPERVVTRDQMAVYIARAFALPL